MAFYAYEMIKNERARQRKQREDKLRGDAKAEGVTLGIGIVEGIDLTVAKLKENPDLSPEELKKAVMADLKRQRRMH